MDQFDITTLLEFAFGSSIKGSYKPSYNEGESKFGLNQYKPELKENESLGTETRKSWMGTPIMFPITLKGGNQIKIFDEKGDLKTESYGDFKMPAVTLVDFSRSKILSKTYVRGASGSVKEMFGFEDWKIRMRGLCLNEPGIRTAKQQMEGLTWFEKVAEPVEVTGYQFLEMQISTIVINSITFRQIEGKPWVIPFEIDAESNTDILLMD